MNEIQELINGHMQKNKYISCLEDLYVLFEKNSISYSERCIILKEIYKYNKKVHASEERRAQKLEKMENQKIVVAQSKPEKISRSIEKSNKNVEALQCDVSLYMDKIKNFSDVGELEIILPSREDEHFDNIIDMILTKLYQEKVEIINLIHEQQENEPSISQFFDEELEDIDYRMETLLDYKNDFFEEDEISTEKTNNKIVFLKNSFGEPMIISSLKGYEEYYESFLELINSIIDGTFKNKRTFLNNNKIVDLMEVKGFKTRILFSRLKNDIYVVMPAFVKKCDTDLRHRIIIQNISQMYQLQKDELMNALDNEDFMKQEQYYLDELIKTLDEKKKVYAK